MNRITLENFRCFRAKQTARLAPLTLLVGENSTGKTSFMAMVRALWDVRGGRAPDFKEAPYNLGSFDEIAHHRGKRGGRAETFQAGFETVEKNKSYRLDTTFKKRGVVPVIASKRLSSNGDWIEARFGDDHFITLRIGIGKNTWKWQTGADFDIYTRMLGERAIPPFFFFWILISIMKDDVLKDQIRPDNDSPKLTDEEWKKIEKIFLITKTLDNPFHENRFNENRLYASAPVRSKPRRTYDPSRSTPDPGGDYVPTYLAGLYFQDKRGWVKLKKALETVGKISGLFDEVAIKLLGRKESEPFQLQVRKFGGGLKGPWRNLIDVGYGVSQVLPVISELLREDAPAMSLLQQPEVHLHPRAQAALGSLFCQVARHDRQLIVETHSDHLLDRVRMDVRDEEGQLRPDDVSILFFEPGDLDVRIHSLRLDEQGNVLDAPDSYRGFFMEETRRSLGF